MMPKVTIVMTTWAPAGPVGISRLLSGRAALASWVRHVKYEGEVALHIADDGSSRDIGFSLGSDALRWDVTTSRQERHGVGASLNAGFAQAFKDDGIAAYFVDDWRLDSDLDLTPWVKLMIEDDSVGCVRLGPPHPDLSGVIKHLGPLGWVMSLDRHHYAVSQRPALYHRRFTEAYGDWPEDCNAFDCERMMNERFCASLVRVDSFYALPVPWTHVGEVEVGDVEPSANRPD